MRKHKKIFKNHSFCTKIRTPSLACCYVTAFWSKTGGHDRKKFDLKKKLVRNMGVFGIISKDLKPLKQ